MAENDFLASFERMLVALAGQASHLLTGDIKHFGAYIGQKINGLTILTPGEYLRLRDSAD